MRGKDQKITMKVVNCGHNKEQLNSITIKHDTGLYATVIQYSGMSVKIKYIYISLPLSLVFGIDFNFY